MNHKNAVYRPLSLLAALCLVAALCLSTGTSAAEPTSVTISPPHQTISAGDTLTVDIVVDPQTGIAGAQFDLTFDPSLITAVEVAEGDLLSQNGDPTFFGTFGTGIDNVAGTITGYAGVILSQATVSSPGVFATITFSAATTSGTSTLHLFSVDVQDADGVSVPFGATDGSVTVEVTHTLTMAVSGSGSTDPAAGPHDYLEGTVVTISATPDSGWQFDGWTGDVVDSGSSTTTTTIDADKTVTASFAQIMHTLTMAVSGSGSTDPTVGPHDYAEGTVVTISATPDSGWQFDGWTGDVADANAPTTTTTMDTGKTVTASFSLLWDVNSDGCIDLSDLVLVGQSWGASGSPHWIRADVNSDGVVNLSDLVLIGQHWGEGCGT